MKKRFVIFCGLAAMSLAPHGWLRAAPATPTAELSWPDEKTDSWNGYKRHLFKVEGHDCWVVEPKQAAPGNPWTWCTENPDAFTDRTGVPQLIAKGFYHVHVSAGDNYGNPATMRIYDAFYKAFTAKGLAKKGALIGLSRGGLCAYNWAADNTDKVACIYGDAPVCDFKSWPGGKGPHKGGSSGNWDSLIKSWGFKDEAEAMAYKFNPVDNLANIAKAKIPIIHVVGDADGSVPPEDNSAIVEERYKKLGGEIVVIHKPGVGHHPHGLDDPKPLVDFIMKNAGPQ